MLVTDLSSTFQRAGVVIDGILGTDVLRLFAVTLNLSSGAAHFETSGTIPVGAKVAKLQPVGDLYLLPLTVQGSPAKLLLDTGTNSPSISSHAWSRIMTHCQPLRVVSGVQSTEGSENGQFAVVPMIFIGDSSSSDVPLRIQPQTAQGLFADADFDGILGIDLLQQFVVTLDLPNNKMCLARRPDSHVDRDLFSTIGIQFAKDVGGNFVIMAVWNPSPAATAGLKIGDVILSVNKLDPRQMSLDDFSRTIHGVPGTKANLVIDSGGHRHSASIAIRCLLCLSKSIPRETK